MRAPPPEPLTKIKGWDNSRARSIPLRIFSPTTEPMLPRRNLESLTPKTPGIPSIFPVPPTQASESLVSSWALFSLSS